MTVALKLGSNGNLQSFVAGEALQADAFERLSATGNLVVGSALTTGQSLLLGSATATTQVQGAAAFQSYLSLLPLDPTTVPHLEGRMFYDSVDHTISLMNDQPAMLQQLGQELVVRVVNNTGVTITDGQAVYINGVQGNRPTVALAIATDEVTARALGLATHNILNNQEGFVTIIGSVSGYNTSAFAPNDILWVSETTPGALTNVRPSGSNYAWRMGVTANSTVNGKVYVHPMGPERLSDMHDVGTGTPTLGSYLLGNGTQWNSSVFVTDAINAVANNTAIKYTVRACSTANLALSGLLTVDGVALVANDSILVKNQTTASQNGIYVVQSGAWTRRADFATSAQADLSALILVRSGTTNGDALYSLTTDPPITLGTTSLAFSPVGIANANPANIGTAASQGTGVRWARQDHVHAHGTIAASTTAYHGAASGTSVGFLIAPAATTNRSRVLAVAAGADTQEWRFITNANVDAAAAIAVTKLALGGASQILQSNGTVNSWGAFSDTLHGDRGGGTQHATVTSTLAGFVAAVGAVGTVLTSTGTAATWQTPTGGGVPTTRTISTTAPLAGGGDLSADRTLSIASVSNTSSGVVPSVGAAGTLLTSNGTGSTWTALDGDAVSLDFVPTAYTRTTGTPGSSVDQLAAHLRGIDNGMPRAVDTFPLATAGTTVNVEQNDCAYATVIICPYTFTVETVDCIVTQSGGGNIYAAIYDSTLALVVADTVGASCSTVGRKTLTLDSATTLTQGEVYYVVFRCDANGALVLGHACSSASIGTSLAMAFLDNNAAATSFPASITIENRQMVAVWALLR
jgi:hypothetical protein